jgi:hypothetical protein
MGVYIKIIAFFIFIVEVIRAVPITVLVNQLERGPKSFTITQIASEGADESGQSFPTFVEMVRREFQVPKLLTSMLFFRQDKIVDRHNYVNLTNGDELELIIIYPTISPEAKQQMDHFLSVATSLDPGGFFKLEGNRVFMVDDLNGYHSRTSTHLGEIADFSSIGFRPGEKCVIPQFRTGYEEISAEQLPALKDYKLDKVEVYGRFGTKIYAYVDGEYEVYTGSKWPDSGILFFKLMGINKMDQFVAPSRNADLIKLVKDYIEGKGTSFTINSSVIIEGEMDCKLYD